MSNSIVPPNTAQTMLIGAVEVPVLEYQNQRVVTFAMIDKVHQRPEGTARKRFNDNREQFTEDEDYFYVTDPKSLSTCRINYPGVLSDAVHNITFITKLGYLLITKSFRSNTEIIQSVCQNYFQDYSTSFPLISAYEGEFGQILMNALNGLVTIDTQVKFGNYRVDFLIQEHRIIIEYDEGQHTRPIHCEKDREREKVLISLGYKIIRVKKKEPIGSALNKVLTVLWKSKTHSITC